jgi:cell division protein FtsW (lipid II flippase)
MLGSRDELFQERDNPLSTQHPALSTLPLAMLLQTQPRMGNLLWIIIIVLIILWLGGVSLSFGGNLIHILLVIVLILVIVRLATGRRVL